MGRDYCKQPDSTYIRLFSGQLVLLAEKKPAGQMHIHLSGWTEKVCQAIAVLLVMGFALLRQ